MNATEARPDTCALVLVRVRRDIFLRAVGEVQRQEPGWTLKWAHCITGLCLHEHPVYDIELSVEPRGSLQDDGFEVLNEQVDCHERLLEEIDRTVERDLRVKVALGSRYEFKLDGIWAQSKSVDHSTLDPGCDVILSYSGMQIQTGDNT